MEDSKNNLELWSKVEKTNPKYTKPAKIGGMNITSIAPQFQILNATEQFGPYGKNWGFKKIEFDYSITNTPIEINVMDWKTKITEKVSTILGLVGFKATFFFPDGEFEITNSIKIFTDNNHSKIDDNYAKKLETDALTKALSKLGFNADIFLGKFDDTRYLEDTTKEFEQKELGYIKTKLSDCKTIDSLKAEYRSNQNHIEKSEWLKGIFNTKKSELELKQKEIDHKELKSIIKGIEKCSTVEELTEIYNNEKKFVENSDFTGALGKRKYALNKLFETPAA